MWIRGLLLVLLAVTLTGLLLYSQTRNEPRHVSGVLEADEIRLGSRVGGRVKEVLTVEGATVQAGQVLVRFEEFDLDERQAQATAELRSSQAELKRLRAGFRDEERGQAAARVDRLKQKVKALTDGARPEERAAAKARHDYAKAQLDLAQSTYDRNRSLIERDKGTLTREAFDRSIEELKAAEANLEVRDQELLLMDKGTRQEDIAAAQAELAEADQAWLLTKNGSRPEEIERAEAAVAALEAAVAALQALREELEVKAPTAGVVEALDLQAGDLVGASAPVLSLLDRRQLWVRAYVPENRIAVQVGQKVPITVDSFPGRRFEGEITYVSRQAEFTPSNVQTPEERSKQVFRIKVTLREGVDELRAGMACDVWLE